MKNEILRFRVMALIAGVMSLLLWFVYLPVKYLLDNPDLLSNVMWIPMAHGYLYCLCAHSYPICRQSQVVVDEDAWSNFGWNIANCIYCCGAPRCSYIFVNS